jgi:hypothetical protein
MYKYGLTTWQNGQIADETTDKAETQTHQEDVTCKYQCDDWSKRRTPPPSLPNLPVPGLEHGTSWITGKSEPL